MGAQNITKWHAQNMPHLLLYCLLPLIIHFTLILSILMNHSVECSKFITSVYSKYIVVNAVTSYLSKDYRIHTIKIFSRHLILQQINQDKPRIFKRVNKIVNQNELLMVKLRTSIYTTPESLKCPNIRSKIWF